MNVAPKNPIGRLADTAVNSVRDPRGTAEKVLEQAKGTLALGKMVAEQVSRSAAQKASGAAGSLVGHRSRTKPVPKHAANAPRASSPATLRPVPNLNEAGLTPEESRADGPAKQHGDPLRSATRKAPVKKVAPPTPADVAGVVQAAVAKDRRKTAAAPAKRATTKRTAKKAAPGDKLPIRKTAATTAVASEPEKTPRPSADNEPE